MICFIVDVISCNGAVAIKAHCPAKCDGSVLYLSDLHLGRVRTIFRKMLVEIRQ